MSKKGSLSYQMEKALKAVFHPGHRCHHDKAQGREDVIRGINTMRCTVADSSQFARFIRQRWPEVKDVEQVTPAMAQAFIAELVLRERSGGRLG